MTLATMLALLADNTTGDISAADMRAIVEELYEGLSGTTAARPTTTVVGLMYFDTTLNIPIWWRGAAWVNASGSVV
jgi:dihydroorotate dehydrogenase